MTPNATTEIVSLVDDDQAVLKSIGRLLASDGFTVRAFGDPADFLSYVTSTSVPLAILDIWMEQMSGLEVQAKLLHLSPQTRVIIITARNDRAVRQTALDGGATAFFTKPFDDNEFLSAVRTALS